MNGISTPLLSIHLPMSVWLEAEWQCTVPSWWAEFASRAVLLGISALLILLTSPTPVGIEDNDFKWGCFWEHTALEGKTAWRPIF